MAGPNRIWISQDVYQQIRNKIQVRVFPLGPQHLKNIPEQVEVYEILIDNFPEFETPSAKALETLAHNQEELAQKVETEEAIEARNVEEAMQRAKQGLAQREEEQKKEIAEHYTKAQKYYEAGKTKDAEAELNIIYQLDPQQRIDTERRKAEEEQEKKMLEYLQTANELFAAGQLDAAENKINEIFRLRPLHVGAQQLLTQIEEERYRIEEQNRARRSEHAPKQMSDEELRIEELLEQARTLLQEEKFAEATFTLHELFSIDPNHTAARRLEESIRQTELAKAELSRIQAQQAQEEQHVHELAKLQQKVEEQRRQQVHLRQQKDQKSNKKKIYSIAAAVIILAAALFGAPKLMDILFPKSATIAVLQCVPSPRDTSNMDVFDILPVLLAEDFSQCERLTVIAPSSALLYAPDQAHLQKITSLLPTCYLILVNVQENRTGYTLQVRMVIPDEQKIVYVGSVEGQISDLSEMRAGIVQKVIEKMEIKSKLPEIPPVSNSTAFEKYMLAFHLLQRNSRAETDSANTLLLAAVQIDPSFGLAYGMLADIQLRMYAATNDAQFLQSAAEYAQHALRCSSTIAQAHKVLAICARYQQNYDAALTSLTKYLAFMPQDPECYRELAYLSIIGGRLDDAAAYADRALQHDPLNAKSQETVALVHQMKNEYTDAENSYQQAQVFGENEEAVTIQYLQNIWINEGKLQ